MIWKLPQGHDHPLQTLLEDQYQELMAPVHALELEMKRRIDEIPTTAQREAAEAHAEAVLTELRL